MRLGLLRWLLILEQVPLVHSIQVKLVVDVGEIGLSVGYNQMVVVLWLVNVVEFDEEVCSCFNDLFCLAKEKISVDLVVRQLQVGHVLYFRGCFQNHQGLFERNLVSLESYCVKLGEARKRLNEDLDVLNVHFKIFKLNLRGFKKDFVFKSIG